MAITASELEILKIIKQKKGLISMKKLSSKAGFEKGYTYVMQVIRKTGLYRIL